MPRKQPSVVPKHALIEPPDPDSISRIDRDMLNSVAKHEAIKHAPINAQHPRISIGKGSRSHQQPSPIAEAIENGNGVSRAKVGPSNQPVGPAVQIRAVPLSASSPIREGGSSENGDVWIAAWMRWCSPARSTSAPITASVPSAKIVWASACQPAASSAIWTRERGGGAANLAGMQEHSPGSSGYNIATRSCGAPIRAAARSLGNASGMASCASRWRLLHPRRLNTSNRSLGNARLRD